MYACCGIAVLDDAVVNYVDYYSSTIIQTPVHLIARLTITQSQQTSYDIITESSEEIQHLLWRMSMAHS